MVHQDDGEKADEVVKKYLAGEFRWKHKNFVFQIRMRQKFV
jgi:hypothetical protein